MRVVVVPFLACGAAAVLSSCFVVKAPFTIAGNVVQGTYNVGEKVVTTPFDAYDRRQKRKEAEEAAAEKAGKDKDKLKGQAQPGAAPQSSGPPAPGDTLPLPPIDPPQ